MPPPQKKTEKTKKEKKQCRIFYLKMYECIYFISYGKSSETTKKIYFTSFRKKRPLKHQKRKYNQITHTHLNFGYLSNVSIY